MCKHEMMSIWADDDRACGVTVMVDSPLNADQTFVIHGWCAKCGALDLGDRDLLMPVRD